MGGRTNDLEDCARWLAVWLATPFEGGRHIPRLRKIAEYESAHLLRR
jgi:ribose 5-phosphate isomerase RpiB